MKHVADLQSLDRHGGGELAVEHPLLQLLLAANDLESLAAGEHVDRRTGAQDLDLVDDQVALGRVPRQAERPGLPHDLRRRQPGGDIGVGPGRITIQSVLVVEGEQDRRFIVEARDIDLRRRLHPGGSGLIERLVRRRRQGRRA